jgi:hypothetical protein
MNKDKEVTMVTNLHDEEGHLAIDPHIQELGRGKRERFPNRKYKEHFV